MSWSDDTRCLYCEGRLPLYRKITYGQFCSSAHRKEYWQEQERLAIERLQQTHSSLRSYRPVSHPDVRPEVPQGVASYPQLEPVTQVRVATHPALEAAPELEPAFSFDVARCPIPDLDEAPVAAGEFLSLLGSECLAVGGSSPALVAADPFEYEITRLPLPASLVWSSSGTNPLPEGSPISVWSYLPSPQAPASPAVRGERGTQQESEVPLCHPRSLEPAVGIRAAGRVGWSPAAALETPQAVAAIESSLQVLEMEPAPVTSIDLEVPVQSDVLLQLLDQQVPHPDRLHALGQFAAHHPVFAMACPPPQQIDTAPDTVLPAAAAPAIAADDRLASATEMLRLSGALNPAQGSFGHRVAVSEFTANPPAGVTAAMPVVESVHEMGTAGLQSLRSSLLQPVQGVFVRQTTDFLALDLSAGVCSDIKLPNLAVGAIISMAPVLTRLLPLTFGKKRKLAGAAPRLDAVSRIVPQAVETHPVLPPLGTSAAGSETTRGRPARTAKLSRLATAWRRPREAGTGMGACHWFLAPRTARPENSAVRDSGAARAVFQSEIAADRIRGAEIFQRILGQLQTCPE